MALAHSYASIGDHDQAVSSYAHIIRHIDDTCFPALIAIAAEYLRVSKPVIASPYIHMALTADGNDPFALNELGVLFYMRGDMKEAWSAFSKALVLIEDPLTRSTISRNILLVRLKLSCFQKKPNEVMDAIQAARSSEQTRNLPFIQELASYCCQDENERFFLLSNAIGTLSKDGASCNKTVKVLLNRLIEKNLTL